MPRGADRGLGHPPDRHHLASRGELFEERPRSLDLAGVRRAVRVGLAGPVRVGRHDVPEQHVLGQVELVEHAVDDRRRRLGRAVPGQLPLGCERNTADARTAVPGCLADEEKLCARARSARYPARRSRSSGDAAYWLNVEPIRAAASRWIKTRARAPTA
jgi:hypothetical protein